MARRTEQFDSLRPERAQHVLEPRHAHERHVLGASLGDARRRRREAWPVVLEEHRVDAEMGRHAEDRAEVVGIAHAREGDEREGPGLREHRRERDLVARPRERADALVMRALGEGVELDARDHAIGLPRPREAAEILAEAVDGLLDQEEAHHVVGTCIEERPDGVAARDADLALSLAVHPPARFW